MISINSAKDNTVITTSNDFIIINPGIRLPEDSVGDQKRIATPEDAVRDGADYLVIGRSITDASDPAAKAAQIRSRIE